METYQRAVDLQPKQEQLLNWLEESGEATATVLGLGGSRGSSKSAACRRAAIVLAMKYEKIVVYIVRRVLGDVLENHMEKIALEFPWVHQYYRPGDYEYDLPNGSRIVFVYAENPIDVKRVSYGPECTFLFIDQAEQFSEDELLSFRICNRWPAMKKGFAKTCLFFNVGVGVGAGYLRRIFHLRQYRLNEEPADYRFLQAYGWDNYEWFRGELPLGADEFYQLSSEERFTLFITKTSEGKKMNSLPEHRRQGELLGNFDVFGGQYFSDVWSESAILTREQVRGIVQPWWVRWCSQDWGFGDHTFHCWFVTGKLGPEEWEKHFGGQCEWPMDVVILYREYLINGRAEADLANDIVEMTPTDERRQIKDFFLSADAFGQRAKQRGANTIGEAYGEIMHRHGMPRPSVADQDRINGFRFFYNCLRQSQLRGTNVDSERARQGPALFVSVDCPAAIENIPLAPRDEKEVEDVAKIAGAIWEDVCVAGDTFVRMGDGREKRIDEIQPGEEVMTRKGWRRVKQAMMTGHDRPVVEAEFSDGSRLICTPEHRIWTEGGWKRIDCVKDVDRVYGWSNLRVGNIEGMAAVTGNAATWCSIGKYGSRFMGRFRQGIISITRMGIEGITTSRIWNANSKGRQWERWRECRNWQRHGTDRKLAGHGIESMHWAIDGATSGGQKWYARSAGNDIRGLKDIVDFVRVPVNAAGECERSGSGGNVGIAETDSLPVAIGRPLSVRWSALKLLGLRAVGKRDVYNLEVEGEHEYFANGILVHNCDGIRYGLKSKLDTKKTAPLEVRAKVICQSTMDPHERAMRMAHFNERERRRRVVGRSPRWRM